MSKILWIDDDYQGIMGLVRLIEQAGHQITGVRTIHSALQELRSDKEYELFIIDILLPIDESTDTSVPDCIKMAGDNTGEGLIAYIRNEMNLSTPIIIISILAGDSQLKSRLEPYEVSSYLPKGALTPSLVKETVDQALNETNIERVTLLNLRSKYPKRRKVGLLASDKLPLTAKLDNALNKIKNNDADPELRNLASLILEKSQYTNLEENMSNEEGKPPFYLKVSPRNCVFIGYSHKDHAWLEKLQSHLKTLVREDAFIVWSDKDIKTGAEWRKEIQKALSLAKVAVLLVSPNFLSSDFIVEKELHPLLLSSQKDGVTIIWVAISASLYEETKIEEYQAANNPNEPLDSMPKNKQNVEFVKICKQIKSAMSS
jgi:CheY-like chemotaxis protein